jgi:hypothetical protein
MPHSTPRASLMSEEAKANRPGPLSRLCVWRKVELLLERQANQEVRELYKGV